MSKSLEDDVADQLGEEAKTKVQLKNGSESDIAIEERRFVEIESGQTHPEGNVAKYLHAVVERGQDTSQLIQIVRKDHEYPTRVEIAKFIGENYLEKEGVYYFQGLQDANSWNPTEIAAKIRATGLENRN